MWDGAVSRSCFRAVDGGHGVHPADEQRQPLLGHRVGPHEVGGVSKLRIKAASLMPLAVREYLPLYGRWAVPWLTRATTFSARWR